MIKAIQLFFIRLFCKKAIQQTVAELSNIYDANKHHVKYVKKAIANPKTINSITTQSAFGAKRIGKSLFLTFSLGSDLFRKCKKYGITEFNGFKIIKA